MFSVSLSYQTFSEDAELCCLCVAGEHGRRRQGSAVLQTSSVCGERGEPAPIRPGVLHAGVSHQHPVPGLETGLRPRSAAGQHRHTGRVSHGCDFVLGFVMRVVVCVFCRMINGVSRSTQSFSLCSRILRSGWALCSDTHTQRILGNGVIQRRMCRVSSHSNTLLFPACTSVHLYSTYWCVCRYHDPSG